MKKTEVILLVDDDPTNINVLVHTLKDFYSLVVAKDGKKALDLVDQKNPDLILLDINMPGMDGYQVCTQLKSNTSTKDIPVIFLSALTEADAKNKGFDVGAVDYITKPFNITEVRQRVKAHLSIKKVTEIIRDQNVLLEKQVAEKTAEIRYMLEGMLDAMSLTVEIRDPYTAGHQHRVAQLGIAIAKKMELAEVQIRTIHYAGSLHDIGKICVPVSILTKPGKLLPQEFELIKLHPQVGFEILQNIPSSLPIAEVVHQHHEYKNGSGYPQGLKDEEILLEAKILTVADVTEAMATYRPYRPALGVDVALEELNRGKGEKYEIKIVECCEQLLTEDDQWKSFFNRGGI